MSDNLLGDPGVIALLERCRELLNVLDQLHPYHKGLLLPCQRTVRLIVNKLGATERLVQRRGVGDIYLLLYAELLDDCL